MTRREALNWITSNSKADKNSREFEEFMKVATDTLIGAVKLEGLMDYQNAKCNMRINTPAFESGRLEGLREALGIMA